jgi:hypothetical protein
MHLPEGWEPVEDAERLEAELAREIQDGHPLWGRQVRALARARVSDDFLFEVDGGPTVASVHLTWQENDRPPWPWTNFHDSVERFASERGG